MKKTYILLTAAVLGVLTVSATEKFLGFNCKDEAAMTAALSKSDFPEFYKLSYAVDLIRLQSPQEIGSYQGMCAVIDHAASRYKLSPKSVEDAKIQFPYHKGIFIIDGYNAARKHPFSIMYLTNPVILRQLALTRTQIYEQGVFLLANKTFVHALPRGYPGRVIPQLLLKMQDAFTELDPERIRADYQEIKKSFEAIIPGLAEPAKASLQKNLESVIAVIDENSSSKAAGDCSGEDSLIHTPPMDTPPVIDGKINDAEWKNATRVFGAISNSNDLLCGRGVTFYIGCDADNIYFAQKSDMPPPSIKFDTANAAELVLITPGGKKHSFRFNCDGSTKLSPEVRVAHSQSDEYWESELVIPLKTLGLEAMPWGEKWKLQMARHWQTPVETGVWHPETGKEKFGTLVFEQGIPAVSFDSMGRSPVYCFRWRCENTTAAPVMFKCDAERSSIENPISYVRAQTVAPEKSHTFELRGMWATGTIRTMRMSLLSNDKTLFKRRFNWDYGKSKFWTIPDPPIVFDIAVYPSYGKAKARLRGGDASANKIKAVEFKIVNTTGEIYFKIPALKRETEFFQKWDLPKLPNGDYKLTAELTYNDGKTNTYEKTFSLKSFPWQNNNIGMERVIIPPFKPLSVDDKQREVHATLTGYRMSGAFWDRIYAQDENILASPIELTVNNKKFDWLSTRLVAAEPDRVIYESLLNCGELKLKVIHDYDYDGFCKVTMNFVPPENGINIESMKLELPLKEGYAKLMHSTIGMLRRNVSSFIPEEKGSVWDSTKAFYPKHLNRGNFRPYFWFGEFHKGLSWMCEGPRNWSMAEGKPSLELIRDGNAVIMRANIVNNPKRYDKPFEIVMAFQPTPVKPQPEGFRKLCDVLYHRGGLRFDNTTTLRLSNTAWRGATYTQSARQLPPNNDWSWSNYLFAAKGREWDTAFEKEVSEKVKAYMKKHNWAEEQRGVHPPERHLSIGIQHNRHTDIYEAYFNPRLLVRSDPEFDMYADEWQNTTFRHYRDVDEYDIDTDKNYQDFLLWSIRETVRNGWDVVNFDNCYDINVSDDITGPGVEISPGVVQAYTSIFAMRELVKRTATMLYTEKKLLLGRPALTVHMTNSLIVPMHSFAVATKNWEMNYGGQDFQDRFPEGYVFTETLGTQLGTIPIVLIQSVNDRPNEVAKTILATTLGYDLLFYRDGTTMIPPFFIEAVNIVRNFGYGNSDVTVYPGWSSDNPVRLGGVKARATVLVKGGKSMLLIGSFGSSGTLKIDLTGLKYEQCRVSNAETGVIVGSGSEIQIELPRHDYRILLVEQVK